MKRSSTRKHVFIPDMQIKPNQDNSFVSAVGKYVASQKPDVIVNAGDFADMPSLSSYDRGKKSFEGRRYQQDIDAASDAMKDLMKPIKSKMKRSDWNPRLVMCLGNHEERIARAINNQPELDGIMGYHNLPYDDWEVHDFLKPVVIDGILYSHYMANPNSGKPYGGQALTVLKNVGVSYVVGHQQTLEMATRHLPTGQQQWGIKAGACYPHDEDYKGYQGNAHWRGLLVLHEVENGSFDPMVVSLEYIMDEFGS